MKKLMYTVLTLCVISMSCKEKKIERELDMNNPFFSKPETPYGVPAFDQIKTEHYLPAFEEAMLQQKEEIEAIVNNKEKPTFENTIEALDYSGELLNTVALVFFNMCETNNSDEMIAIADTISPKLAAHSDDISLNPKLFERVKTVYEQKDKSLNPEQQRLLEETYKNFVRGGANIPVEKQARFREINEELSKLTLKFGNNVLAATNAYKMVIEDEKDLAGLPESLKAAAAETANQSDDTKGKWVFTIHNPSLLPFLQFADNRAKREEIWRAYSNRCIGGEFDNTAIISKIVKLRAERAQILGFKTHADFVLDERMAKTPTAVYDLLQKVWNPALAKAKEELEEYQQLANKEKPKFDIKPWDWRYYTEKVRKAKYELNDEVIRPYFKLENVRDGIFMICKELYGLTFKENADIPTYDPEAVAYEVIDNGNVIGILYMDYFTRSSKRSGAWMTEFRGQHKTKDNENVIPIISLVLNFSRPTADMPCLLNFDETETFFHEFGHGLHGLLSNCKYRSLAGTNVTRDFVELPSQIMENWARHPEVLKLYAKHYISGESIPDELIKKIEAAGNYGQGFINTELIAASFLDMDYHVLENPTISDPIAFENEALAKYGLIPEIISRYRSPYFQHIFTSSTGYSAGYYSYTWSAVLDADAFEVFKQNGLFDKATATSFRKNILEKGNTEDPALLYKAFRKQEPSIEPLLRNRGLLPEEK
ncbi:MAG: M3 family metallopeptidase [Bacteroidales bacterium]|jgi:peptidyl-dipeptidase Dcp|nr:M3 family metallopeptidase [Bacteroidales bacterium]